MTYIPVTAFRRAFDAGQMQRNEMRSAPLPPNGVNKWEVMRELTAARQIYGLSDRDLAVLETLLSFHPATILGGNDRHLVVHPSNVSICERLKGMACSTMRRHLSRLVQAGFLLRRDSPNGKRYVRRSEGERLAFGFDLTPLVLRNSEICENAEKVRADATRLKRQREAVSLMRRDLAGLAGYGASARPDVSVWARFSELAETTARALRRRLQLCDLALIEAALLNALDCARDLLDSGRTSNTSTNGASFEQHHQNSNTEPYDSELCLETGKGEAVHPEDQSSVRRIGELEPEAGPAPDKTEPALERDAHLPNVPLGLVVSVCRELQTYADAPIRHWHHLVNVVDRVRPMMGVSPSAWDEAKAAMGAEQAAVVLAAMLEKFAEIKSPGGYLRTLTRKAECGTFSCGPMIMALLRKAA